jgi:hypothetical protein
VIGQPAAVAGLPWMVSVAENGKNGIDIAGSMKSRNHKPNVINILRAVTPARENPLGELAGHG